MSEHGQVLETITRLFWATDHHNWEGLRAALGDPVVLDYTALNGGEPATMTPAEATAAWEPMFKAIDAHQHLVSNHLIDVQGDQATATASFIATHQYGGDTWTLGVPPRAAPLRSEGNAVLRRGVAALNHCSGFGATMAR